LFASVPLEPSRRRLLPGPAADAVLAAAAEEYPALVELVASQWRTALVPRPGFPRSDVDGRLRDAVLAVLTTATWLPSAESGARAPAGSVVLDLPDAGLTAALADLVPGLLAWWLAEPGHAGALAALGVPRLDAAGAVAAVSGVDRAVGWWSELYAALDRWVAADASVAEALGALPVPLADGRTAIGPRDVLLPSAELGSVADLAELTGEVIGLKLAHPKAAHPLLARLGARPAEAADVLDSPAIQEAVEHSVDDAESGGPTALTNTVLTLVGLSGTAPGERSWLSALALTDVDGDVRRSDELVLPGAPLLAVLAADVVGPDGPMGIVDAELAERWPAEVLRAVGVIDSFALVVDESPSGPDHDLPDEDEWWAWANRATPDLPPASLHREFANSPLDTPHPPGGGPVASLSAQVSGDAPNLGGCGQPNPLWMDSAGVGGDRDKGGPGGGPRTLVGIRDLDLVDPDRWPDAIRLLAGSPDTARALADPTGYPAWWLARYADLAGGPPRSWRLGTAGDLVGLYDRVPDLGLDDRLLAMIGVRARLIVADTDDARDLLHRLGDPEREVPVGAALRAHATLVDTMWSGAVDSDEIDPPDRVRTLSGATVAADRAAVLDLPWLLGLLAEDLVVAADVDPEAAGPEPSDPVVAGTVAGRPAEILADLLNVALASELVADATVESTGELLDWSALGAVRLACELIGAQPPDGSVFLHDELVVRGPDESRRVPWWIDGDGRAHAEDSAEGLARALAWSLGRWTDRWALAGLINEPAPGTLLG
jgi:hypothetical protein